MHKVLISVYMEAIKQFERAFYFERETSYTIFVFGLSKVSANANLLSGAPEETSGGKCLLTFRSIFT
jgi:hypothetical protein